MPEDMESKFRRIVNEAWNNRNLDALDELHTADFILHQPPFPDIHGLEAFKQHVAGVHIAYPDFYIRLLEFIDAGDRIATRWEWTGTHLGQTPIMALPPTGRHLTVVGGQVIHLRGELLAECWQYGDYLGALQQEGLIPKAAPA